jgi:Fe-S cluster assembly protein SufD
MATAQLFSERSFSAAGFEAFLESRVGEPDWLLDSRRRAFDRFLHSEWPSQRSEEWLRSSLRMFKLDQFSIPSGLAPSWKGQDSSDGKASVPLSARPLLTSGVEFAGQVQVEDGVHFGEQLESDWLDRGVLCGSLDRLVCEQPELIREHLMSRAFDVDYDRFAALTAAFWTGGFFVYVPKGVSVSLPLHLSSVMRDGGSDFGHTLIVLDEGAQATVLQESLSPTEEASGLHVGGVEILLGPRANLRYVNLQDWGKQVWHFAHQRAVLQRDASLQWTVGALGSGFAKVNQSVELAGRNAISQVNGVLFTEGKQHLAYHTLQHHRAPSCRSDFLYKSAQQDRSHTVWRGMIKVDLAAQKTDGYQRNDNLILSNTARADSIPGLEIQADDVRCTHGSTTSKVDEELIFYANCRGLRRKEAARLIVSGFFQQVIDRITIDSVREALGNAIASRVRET